ncbi:MAG: GAF domain-containing protein, partial [Bacteroidia bacterium]|nr:GAF domain-containing protein [Bacteroidia bacterium]
MITQKIKKSLKNAIASSIELESSIPVAEQRRILLTQRMAYFICATMLIYIPLGIYSGRDILLYSLIFSFLFFVGIIILIHRRKFLLGKILLCTEPVIHLILIELTQGGRLHLFNIVFIATPFILFNFKNEKIYPILLGIVNTLSVVICEFVIRYPEYNPFVKNPVPWELEYANWIFACLINLSLVSLLALTNSQNEDKIIESLHETKKLNQEIASREEELKQNLEELQAMQESLVREKESTAYKSALFSVAAKANEQLLIQKNPSEVIQFILRTVGQTLGLERGYYFERDSFEESEVATVSQKIEWVVSPEFSAVDNPAMYQVPISVFSDFYTVIAKNQIYHAVVNDLPSGEFKDILVSMGIKALIVAPVFVQERFHGFVGWNLYTRDKVFSIDEVNIVYSLSYSLSVALQNIQNELQIQQKNQELIAREEELKQNLEELHA